MAESESDTRTTTDTSISRPPASYGVSVVRILEKIDFVITALHYNLIWLDPQINTMKFLWLGGFENATYANEKKRSFSATIENILHECRSKHVIPDIHKCCHRWFILRVLKNNYVKITFQSRSSSFITANSCSSIANFYQMSLQRYQNTVPCHFSLFIVNKSLHCMPW